MVFSYENIRLRELAAIADMNMAFFNDFVDFLISKGYDSVFAFVLDTDDTAAFRTILEYLNREIPEGVALYNGVGRPYSQNRAKWLLLGWLFRDAPEQRLRPMVSSMAESTINARRAMLLNMIRKDVLASFPDEVYWQWPNIREVFIDRLEGSRRSLRGSLIEEIVRRVLRETFSGHNLMLEIADAQVQLEGETYDVSVSGAKGTILIPVKTRETMGGGHALLFTRDIHKSISVAHESGYVCVPIIIAESWTGDLESLGCEKTIYININPNRLNAVEERLRNEISEIRDYIQQICLYE